MTRERTQEIIVAAFVLSIIIHIGVMIYARTRVMTEVASGVVHKAHKVMKVTERKLQPEVKEMTKVKDLKAVKDEPAAKPMEGPSSVASSTKTLPAVEVKPRLAEPMLSERTVEAPKFELKKSPNVSSTKTLPVVEKMDLPAAKVELSPLVPKTDTSLALFNQLKLPEVRLEDPLKGQGASRFELNKDLKEFTPSLEVYDRVDEGIVEAEKAAVRNLLTQGSALALKDHLNLKLRRFDQEKWTYFALEISPKTTLKKIPKDFVVLIDASGSIGKDRMGSIRKAAKRILRSAANTGDRFNLVAFRDDFTYAFRRWQDYDAVTYEAADNWLNRVAPFGRTDVFATISSVLTLPRNPKRPLIALVITDGEANEGVSDNAAILSKFTELNDGLISVYMYGVKSSANRELIKALTRGNRGESFVFEGFRWSAGEGLEGLSERFRDPVLSDLKLVFASGKLVEAYPERLKNLYLGDTLELVGRVPKGTAQLEFSLSGLNRGDAYEDFFRLPFATAIEDEAVIESYMP